MDADQIKAVVMMDLVTRLADMASETSRGACNAAAALLRKELLARDERYCFDQEDPTSNAQHAFFVAACVLLDREGGK